MNRPATAPALQPLGPDRRGAGPHVVDAPSV